MTHHIEAGDYRIHVGEGALSTLNSLLNETTYRQMTKFILCDENTVEYCVPDIIASVNALKEAQIIEIESGEPAKNIDTCIGVWKALAESGANRNSVIINIGGGVVTDLGGFCASTYMRGIPFVNVPTTLLSMADGGFGGKNGVDLDELKNIVGCFRDPVGVFCYPKFLSTLAFEHILSGLAEIMKHGLIADKNHWTSAMKGLSSEDPSDMIAASIRIKMNVVNADPKETGQRKLLNFGHTIGHAMESYYLRAENPIHHGFMVAAGIIAESFLSHKNELLEMQELDEIVNSVLGLYKEHIPNDFNEGEVIQLMMHDKKNKDGNINFTLLNGIGNSVYDRTFNTKEILEALNYLKQKLTSS
jgi:3-dehydroquinate synthase